jgi:Uma2 family endonuclease
VGWKLVERHSGAESSAIAAKIVKLLVAFVERRRPGHVFTTDCGYQCFLDQPGKVRKPDVSFIRAGRLAEERIPEGYILIAPDLAVEVISPGDLAYEVDEKVQKYLGAGVKLVWVINPKTRTVRIHRPGAAALGPIGALSESSRISGEDVLPEFECAVAEFFQI